MRLDELFELRSGIAVKPDDVQPSPVADTVPLIRPASTQRRTVAGWIDRKLVMEVNIYPAATLFVSTNGEGSHTYSYVSQFEFVPNSDVTTLIPKRGMTIVEKVYYARCITMNRYRFSYGRKPKGNRLGSILVPDEAPKWVAGNDAYDAIKSFAESIQPMEVTTVPELAVGLQKIGDLFEVHYGNGLARSNLKMVPYPEGINFIARGQIYNGVDARVIPPEGEQVWSAGLLTVALSGSVLSTFVQPEPFVTAYHVAVLVPKRPMSLAEKLWWCRCIGANQYRYNYGRQANRTLSDLLIPTEVPKWVGTTPHDAVEELRGGILEIADVVQSPP